MYFAKLGGMFERRVLMFVPSFVGLCLFSAVACQPQTDQSSSGGSRARPPSANRGTAPSVGGGGGLPSEGGAAGNPLARAGSPGNSDQLEGTPRPQEPGETGGSGGTMTLAPNEPPPEPVPNEPETPPDTDVPFEPMDLRASATRVKTFITGKGLTDTEWNRLSGRGELSADDVDTWMRDPAYQQRLLDIFSETFQQKQTVDLNITQQWGFQSKSLRESDERMVDAVRTYFARTALALVNDNRPFTETLTTTRFMLNPPLMALLAYLDANPIDDDMKRPRETPGSPTNTQTCASICP